MTDGVAFYSQPPEWSSRMLRSASILLVASVWVSSAIFGAYILAFYGGAVQDNTPELWNTTLPRIYEPTTPLAAVGIGAHFAAGAILLLLGPVQLIGAIRARAPTFHRWTGRFYAFAAFAAGLGGLSFIALKGTVGGAPMTAGFSLYGALMVVCSVETARNAMMHRMATHRAWAIRLFALAVGSWLYRMDYGFWTLLTGNVGHTKDFRGWFDFLMDFTFFLPNLAVAEMFIRANGSRAGVAGRAAASVGLLASASFVILATYFFTTYAWGPAIVGRFAFADPPFHWVIPRCDRVGEVCPEFSGAQVVIQRSSPKPANGEPDDFTYPYFQKAAAELATRAGFLCTPLSNRIAA